MYICVHIDAYETVAVSLRALQEICLTRVDEKRRREARCDTAAFNSRVGGVSAKQMEMASTAQPCALAECSSVGYTCLQRAEHDRRRRRTIRVHVGHAILASLW